MSDAPAGGFRNHTTRQLCQENQQMPNDLDWWRWGSWGCVFQSRRAALAFRTLAFDDGAAVGAVDVAAVRAGKVENGVVPVGIAKVRIADDDLSVPVDIADARCRISLDTRGFSFFKRCGIEDRGQDSCIRADCLQTVQPELIAVLIIQAAEGNIPPEIITEPSRNSAIKWSLIADQTKPLKEVS